MAARAPSAERVRGREDMLDFCGKHNITCPYEMISGDKITESYERVVKSDVKYRFVPLGFTSFDGIELCGGPRMPYRVG